MKKKHNTYKSKQTNLKKKMDKNTKDISGSKVLKMFENVEQLDPLKQELNEKKVNVVGFISTGDFHDDSVQNPIGDDWLNGIKESAPEIPQELIIDLRKNGWENAKGNVCFRLDYQPLPVRGTDGNVYLAMNDSTMHSPAGMGYMMDAYAFLVTGSTNYEEFKKENNE